MVKIALDAGHGMNTAGKRTPDGEREWTFNSKALLACQAKLNTYQNVQVLRLDDPTGQTDVPLRTRTDRANNWGADVLVSIHHNALTGRWHSGGGVETLLQTVSSKASLDIANAVHHRIVKAMGLRDRGIKRMNLHMTRESRMPAILTEGGFMDSTTDIAALRSDARLKAQGEALAEGLAAYFKLQPKAGSASSATVSKKEETNVPNTPNLYKPSSSEIVNATAVVLNRLEQKDNEPLDPKWREMLLKGELSESDATGLLYVAIARGQIVGK